ncbi:hypothetical protein R1sor_023835 [Riccia sorocarpa]|uniref:Uncharacterized protein n=1 Tax=Riccia sorocarpa TaxID=122646 RepID=A0ABD3GR40_9MARC
MGAPGRLKCYYEEEKNQIRAKIQYLSELKECGLLITPNLNARDNINPLFGELNQNPEAGTAEGEQELDPVGSAARLRVGWDPDPVPLEGPDWNSIPSWREGGTPGGNSSPRDTPRGTPRTITGNTPRSSHTPEGLPAQPTIPNPVVIPDPTAVPIAIPDSAAIPVVIPDPTTIPVPPQGTLPTIPLPPIRIPPVNPVHIGPPQSVPAAPTRVSSTVPVNPFVNPWAPAPREPGQEGAQPSVVPRRPAVVNPHHTVPGTAAIPPIPAFAPIPGPIMDLRLRVAYPIFKGKRHEDPDLHIASFEQTMNINGENAVHKARLFLAT